MARLIVWAKPDNDHADSIVNARKYKRGMVVDVLEDGQHAGNDIEKSDWWRIIEVPGEPVASFVYLLGADPKFADLRLFVSEAQYPRKRVQAVDLDAIEAGAGLARGENPELSITLDKSTVDTEVVTVGKLENPQVIGIPVIG